MSARLYERIAQQGSVKVLGKPMAEVGAKILARDPIRIDADVAASWYWANERNDWTMREDLGPLRLPFKEAWIEWKMPSRIYADNRWGESTYSHGGVLVLSNEPSDELKDRGVAEVLMLEVFISSGSAAAILPIMAIISVDADGAYLDYKVATDESVVPKEMASDMAFQAIFPALIAIGLMNCKNVSIDERQPKPMSNKVRRRGEVRYSYHVITLPGASNGASKQKVKDSSGPPVALHVVRGHFKTYTNDAPLFGSRTGTFWWGHQSRGNVESGVSLHDYKVSR